MSAENSIRPIGDRVLLELDEPMTKTPSGIFLPAQAQQKTTEGVVLAVGPGPYGPQGNRAETPIRAGQRVLIPPYSGNEIKDGGNLYQLVRETDIIAIRTEGSRAAVPGGLEQAPTAPPVIDSTPGQHVGILNRGTVVFTGDTQFDPEFDAAVLNEDGGTIELAGGRIIQTKPDPKALS